jgi:uncharacterized protein
MRREEIIDKLRAHAEAIHARGARAVYLFGSTARNEARENSDVDVFIDPDYEHFTLFDWVDLQAFLGDVLGRTVDLTTRNALHPELRERIERSATQVL